MSRAVQVGGCGEDGDAGQKAIRSTILRVSAGTGRTFSRKLTTEPVPGSPTVVNWL